MSIEGPSSFNPEDPANQSFTFENPEKTVDTNGELENEVENDLETKLNSEIQGDLQEAVNIIQEFEKIAEKAETPAQKEKLNSLRKKISRTVKKFFTIGRRLALVGTLAMSINHYVTHPDLEVTEDEQGDLLFKHPDKQTTHILNAIVGRDSISLEESLKSYKERIKNRIKKIGISLPTEFDSYDIDQVDSYLVKAGLDKPGVTRDYFNEYYNFKGVEVSPDESKEIYNLLWEMEEECGNPKFRFQSRGPSVLGIEYSDDDTRAYYDPIGNTFYIPMDLFVGQEAGHEKLFAELAHAKQLEDNPLEFYVKSASSMLRIFAKGKFDLEILTEAHQEEYEISGTLENEAHSEIEPYLAEKYSKITKGKSIGGEDSEN